MGQITNCDLAGVSTIYFCASSRNSRNNFFEMSKNAYFGACTKQVGRVRCQNYSRDKNVNVNE